MWQIYGSQCLNYFPRFKGGVWLIYVCYLCATMLLYTVCCVVSSFNNFISCYHCTHFIISWRYILLSVLVTTTPYLEWSFSCMSHLVDFQLGQFFERLLTPRIRTKPNSFTACWWGICFRRERLENKIKLIKVTEITLTLRVVCKIHIVQLLKHWESTCLIGVLLNLSPN